MDVDPIAPLVEHATQLRAEQVPATVLAFQRRRLLDHVACRIAGHSQASVEALRPLVRRWTGTPEACDLVTGEQLSAPAAALLNGTAARALDYCDVISPGWHPTSSDVPVALAVGELVGASVGDVLVALAVGQDVGQRINEAAQANGFFYRGFDSNVLGLISGAVIAGKLLGLQGDRIRDAIGIAFDYGIGTFQHYLDRTLTVRLGQGLVARAAVEAALFADAGITGPRCILAGDNGFFRQYGPGEPDVSRVTEELGQRFLGEEATCFKLYPCCGQLLALTEAILSAQNVGALMPGAASGGVLRVSPSMKMVCGAPYEPGPSAEVDAQFSACYVAASTLLRGRATLHEFTKAAALEPAVRALAARFKVMEEPSFTHFDECAIRIDTPQGPVELFARFGRGWPENTATHADLARKLESCIQFSGLTMKDGAAAALAHLVERIDPTSAVSSLVQGIVASVSPG